MNVSARRNMADNQGEQFQVRDFELGVPPPPFVSAVGDGEMPAM